MSGVSLPVTRPVGRALLVGNASCRIQPLATLQEIGLGCTELDDPYAAMTEICRRPLIYRALILSLSSLYREELQIVGSVRRRFPHIEVWLAHTDGRQGALADAMRLGADGLLAEDGLHRIAVADAGDGSARGQAGDPSAATAWMRQGEPAPRAAMSGAAPAGGFDAGDALGMPGEPVLTAEELRALLQEQPATPPASGGE